MKEMRGRLSRECQIKDQTSRGKGTLILSLEDESPGFLARGGYFSKITYKLISPPLLGVGPQSYLRGSLLSHK